jgi:hypothetical protein
VLNNQPRPEAVVLGGPPRGGRSRQEAPFGGRGACRADHWCPPTTQPPAGLWPRCPRRRVAPGAVFAGPPGGLVLKVARRP